MAAKRGTMTTVQAWIEPVSDDPEAVSALSVARSRLPGGRRLRSLRRVRLVELAGAMPPRPMVEDLLHRSIQFYNPHKERCAVRTAVADAAPLAADEQVVLVFERGGERRDAAERWWRHETGRVIEVREGVAWVMAFDDGEADSGRATAELALLRDRHRGLLCNPHAQEHRVATGTIPLPWLGAKA